MKWLLSLLCFTTITAFSQVDKPLLEKLKATQEQLKGKSFNNIPKSRVEIYGLPLVAPDTGIAGPGKIPNAARPFDSKPRVIVGIVESMVLALPQDNMPCIVPNMKLLQPMPGVNDKTIAENQKPFKLLQPKPKS